MNRLPVNKQKLYQIASGYSKEMLLRLYELSQSKNENVSLGACKALLNKSLPDLKCGLLDVNDAEKATTAIDADQLHAMIEKAYGDKRVLVN